MARFRAFLSYSHADEAFAARFHKDLESWRADRSLLKGWGGDGSPPRDLRPIFRDRDDFASGQSLSDATEDALRDSDFMILLCSPAAARSRYVNEEIRLFKSLGGSERIIPVIIDGEPGHPDRECFPPALIHRVDDAGRMTDQVEERLAADAREDRDGPRRALAKVIAGILGIPFDEIVRRAERAQRRKLRLIGGIAGVMAMLAAVAIGFAWLSEVRRGEAERNYAAALQAADNLLTRVGGEIIQLDGVSLAQAQEVIGNATAVYRDLQASVPDSAELKQRLIAAQLMFAIAYQDKGRYGAAVEQYEQAEQFQQALAEQGQADATLAAMVAFAQVEKAKALTVLGRSHDAREALRSALAFEPPDDFDLTLPQGLERFSRINAKLALADLEISAAEHQAARLLLSQVEAELAQSRASDGPASDPNSDPVGDPVGGAQGDASRILLHAYRSRIAMAEGDAEAALKEVLIAEQLAHLLLEDRDAKAAILAGLAAVLAEKAGILEALDDDVGAEASRREAISLISRADNADADQRHFAAGEAGARFDSAIRALEDGRLVTGLTAVGPALERMEQHGAELLSSPQLAAAFHNDLGRIARALSAAGLYAQARPYAKRHLDFHLGGASDAATADALSLAASIEEGAGAHAAGLALRLREIDLRGALSETDARQRSQLANALDGAALDLWRLSRRAEALEFMQRKAAVLDSLEGDLREQHILSGDLAWTLLNVGDLSALTGDRSAAKPAYERSRQQALAALAATPEKPMRMVEAAWAEARLAHLGNDAKARWQRVDLLLTEADSRAPLSDFDEELLIIARLHAQIEP